MQLQNFQLRGLHCMMKNLSIVIISFVCYYLRGTQGLVLEGPSSATPLNGTSHELICRVDGMGFERWDEIGGDNEIQIFFEDRKVATLEKFTNFELTGTDYNMRVTSIAIEDEGTYECYTTDEDGVSAVLSVEVIASSVDIDYSGDGILNATESYSFTCTAVGVRSPNQLMLVWSSDSGRETPGTDRRNNTNNSNLQDLTSRFTFMPTKSDTFLSCGIVDYVNQGIISEDVITKTIELTVQYVPICTVELDGEVGKSGCTVTLTCKCDAKPEVTEGGYSYFMGDSLMDSDSSTTKENLDLDTEAVFSCGGSNVVGNGDQSSPETYTCATTTTPTMTLMATSTPEPSSIVLIVVLSCFGGILVVGVAGGSVYWFCFRTSDQESVKRSNNTVTASTNETTNSAAPVYGVVNKSTKKKSDNTDGNGVNSKLQSEPDQVEYAAVNKPKSDPQPAPRSSKPPGNNTEPEKMELQYADIDHSNRGRSNEIHQPADAPTEYATVQSVIV